MIVFCRCFPVPPSQSSTPSGGGGGGADPCGGGEPAKFTDPSGSITSPGGGGQYPDNANCKWLIEAAAGQVRIIPVTK